MVITEYNITKSFDKKTGKIRHIITKDREIVYDMTFKLSKNRNTPFSPIDFLEAALDGEQVIINPQYYRELQNIAFELQRSNKKNGFSFYLILKKLLPLNASSKDFLM